MSWRITGQILDPATGETVNGVITATIDRVPARTTTGGVIDRPATPIPVVEGDIIDTPLNSVPGAVWTFVMPLGQRSVRMVDPGDGASIDLGGDLPVGTPVPESEAVLLRREWGALREQTIDAVDTITSSVDAATQAADTIADVVELKPQIEQSITDAAAAKSDAAVALGKVTQAVTSQDTATAQNITSGEQTKQALQAAYASQTDSKKKPIAKDEHIINVRDYGAVGDGATDDTEAFKAAISAAIQLGRKLWVPKGAGSYVVDAPLLVRDTTAFHMDMEGRTKRKNTSTANSTWFFLNVQGVTIGRLNVDGNVDNNGSTQSGGARQPVDESKPCVRFTGCTDVTIDTLDGKNTACDTLYIDGRSQRFKVGHVNAVNDTPSGRNGVSLIDCNDIQIGTITSINVGCPTGTIAMPGGLDIEPNEGESVSRVTVDRVIVTTAGTSGFNAFGQYRSGQIQDVTVGSVILTKLPGVPDTACDIAIRGVQGLYVGKIQHRTDPSNTNQALSIDDAEDVEMNVDIPFTGKSVNLGAGAAVTRLRLNGRIGKSGQHCLQIYRLNDSTIDMTLKNPANGWMVISKNEVGSSSKVTFRGDWAKDQTGSWAMNVAASVTGWLLDGTDFTGWPNDGRVKGSGTPEKVARRNVKGLTADTHEPWFDAWDVGMFVENTAPTVSGADGSKSFVRGWRCVAAGSPGTWVPEIVWTGA